LTGRFYGPLLAVFARDEFHVGSTAFGLMVSAGGLGTLVGAFGLAGMREVSRKGRLITIAVLTQGVLLLVFAVSPWYALSLPLLAGIGVVNAVSGASIATLIQLEVPSELRGRVMSLYLLTVVGLPSVGSFIFGTFAESVGVREAVAVAAVLFLLLSSALLMRNESVRQAV
jgi:MFS family permease